jgi:hypothetical protein
MPYPIQQLPTGYLLEKSEKLENAIARIEEYAAHGKVDFVLAELTQVKHLAGALSDEAGRLRVDALVAT